MRFWRCPCCAEFVHFRPVTPVRKCWNCGEITDYSNFRTCQERLGPWLHWCLRRALHIKLPSCMRLAGVGKLALVLAMPLAVVMLLLSNSLDIQIVRIFMPQVIVP